MKNTKILVLLFLLLPACNTPGGGNEQELVIDKNDPTVKAVLGCSAGLLSKYAANAKLETDLSKAIKEKKLNLKIGVELEEWVKGYIFDKVPEAQVVEAYKLYLDCYEKEKIRISAGLDPRIIIKKERTQTLWNKYAEYLKLGRAIPISDAEEFAFAGAAFDEIPEDSLDNKNKIIRFDRQSLVYFIASEIVIKQKNKNDFELMKGTAIDYSRRSLAFATKARSVFEQMTNSSMSDADVEWIKRQQIGSITLDRLAEAQAQGVFLGTIAAEVLNTTLRRLSCEYLNEYRIAEEPVYSRISLPERFSKCDQLNVTKHKEAKPMNEIAMDASDKSNTSQTNNSVQEKETRPPIDAKQPQNADVKEKLKSNEDDITQTNETRPPIDAITPTK